MSSSRNLRPGSPTGRRFENPGRASTGTVSSKSHEMPGYTTRETFTSPRSSGDRVVPISKETYVNGQLVDRKGSAYDSGNSSDRHHHRRSTYDVDPRTSSSGSNSNYLRPSVVHHDRDVSPGDRSAPREDRYVSSSSAPRREHRKLYSVDDGRATRIAGDQESRKRDERVDDRAKPAPADRSHAYHLRGSTSSKNSSIDDYGAYEYTDARGMFRDTEPSWRPRRGSVDTVTRERPTSMLDPYQTAPRTSNRELGPPPSTRGFDKVKNSAGSAITRHGSLQGPYQRSPSRSRGYTTSSTYSDDENYPVAPRVPKTRDDSSYSSTNRGLEMLSPTRPPPDDYYEPKRKSRFEDRDVASRGFGIRAPSVDARSSRESDFDRYTDRAPEPLMIEAPPPAQPIRREYPPEPREAVREERLKEPEWRVKDRSWEKDQDVSRGPRESPPLRDREAPRGRERDTGGDYDYPPREREKDFEDTRRDREREYRERDYDRYSDEDRRPRERRAERSERDYYDEGRRDPRDDHEHDDRREAYDHAHTTEAIAGTAAAGAAAYGAKEMYDKRHQDDRRDDRDRERDRRLPPEPREPRQAQPGVREGHVDERKRDEREREKGDRETERSRRYEEEEDDRDRPRRRTYVSKKQEAEAVERRDGDLLSSKHSETLDPEEDYRRRVQQQQQEMSRSQGRRDEKDEDSDRERRRRDRDGNRDSDKYRADPRTSEGQIERTGDSQALTRYDTHDNEITESPVSEDASETSEEKRKKRVSIVDPPKEQKAPKSILRKPTAKFPEDPNPIREGVAPLKDAKAAGDKNIPIGARWTKINRSMVNPEALDEKGERYEERQDHVIVLRVLTREEVQKLADRTKEIRDARYAERKEKEKKEHHSGSDERDYDGHHDRDHHHDHDRRDREKEREHEREHDRDRERERESERSKATERYKPEGY